jgi:hypothetical protein
MLKVRAGPAINAETLKWLESEAEDDDESEDEQMRKSSMNGKTGSENR